MNEAMVEPAPGSTPTRKPMIEPCAKAKRQSRRSCSVGSRLRRPLDTGSSCGSSRASRLASTSPIAKMPIATTTKSMPDRSSIRPKVKREVLVKRSVPTPAIHRPTSVASSALAIERPASSTTIERPSAISPKYSGALKASAKRASGGATSMSPSTPTVPAMKEAMAAMPSAGPAAAAPPRSPASGRWRCPSGQRHAERQWKHEIEARDHAQRDQRRDRRRAPVHHRDDEEGERRKAKREAHPLQRRDRNGERGPRSEGTPGAAPVRWAVRAENDQIGRAREDRDAIPEREEARPGPVLRQVIPAARLYDDVSAERGEHEPRPEVRGTVAHLLLLFLRRFLCCALLRRRLRFRLRVAAFRHELAHGAARRAELHRHHARIADDLAAVRLHLAGRRLDAVDLDREVVDARPLARRSRLRRLGAGVVPDQRHVEHAVAQVPRGVVAHLLGIHLHEPED